MPTLFSQLLRTVSADGDGFQCHIPADWMQGRSVFGGLQVAVALRAMRALVPDAALRTVQASFVAPVPAGRLGAAVSVLRRGKNATHVEARLLSSGATAAIVIGIFGEPRASAVAVIPAQPPVATVPTAPFRFVEGGLPNFVQHFEARWLRGSPPFMGDPSREHVVEVTMRDEGHASEEHVVAIADFIPPLALSYLPAPAPGSTLTWMLELLQPPSRLPLAGFRVDAELVAARDGYTSQSVMVWGPNGEPLAISRQNMLVFG